MICHDTLKHHSSNIVVPVKKHGAKWLFNSLAPSKFESNFRHVIFKRNLVIDSWGIYCEISLIWMSLDFTDYQSTLVQVMAWCRQAIELPEISDAPVTSL